VNREIPADGEFLTFNQAAELYHSQN